MNNNNQITIFIDGKEVKTREGISVLTSALEAGIYIPSLCAYPGLPPSGACRMCLVQIDGIRGYPPACTTNVSEGMKITTNTEELQIMRKEILKMILSEHPSSCLICWERKECESFRGCSEKSGKATGCMFCSKRGDCELEKVTNYLGITELDFPIRYRNIPLQRMDPFYDRDYNLCIVCGRCVRVCQDVRGIRAISLINRGSETIIGTPYEIEHLDSACTFCGSCVDVCPTGALSSRATRWYGESEASESIVCPHCGVGCKIEVSKRKGKIIGSKPDLKGPANAGFLCVKGHFGIIEYVHNNKRRKIPLIKESGDEGQGTSQKFKEVSWEPAVDFVSQNLQKYKGEQFATIIPSTLTLEDAYIFSKFTRTVMESNNIVTDEPTFVLNTEKLLHQRIGTTMGTAEFTDIDNADSILIIGADPIISHQVLEIPLKRAIDKGTPVYIINPNKVSTLRLGGNFVQIKDGYYLTFLSAIARLLIDSNKGNEIRGFSELKESLKDYSIESLEKNSGVSINELKKVVDAFIKSPSTLVMFGRDLMNDLPALDMLLNIAIMSGKLYQDNGGILPLYDSANQVGVALAGGNPSLLPGLGYVLDSNARETAEKIWNAKISDKHGENIEGIVDGIKNGKIKALYLAGHFPEPELLSKLEFLILQSPFEDGLEKYASVVLPVNLFAETKGTYISIERRMQSLIEFVKAPGLSIPDWKIVVDVAKKMNGKGFDFENTDAIFNEFVSLYNQFNPQSEIKNSQSIIPVSKQKESKLTPLANIKEISEGKELPKYRHISYARNVKLSDIVDGFLSLERREKNV